MNSWTTEDDAALQRLTDRHNAGGAALMRGLVPAPARPLRIRVFVDDVHGPSWLRLLALCAFLRGDLLAPQLEGELLAPPS